MPQLAGGLRSPHLPQKEQNPRGACAEKRYPVCKEDIAGLAHTLVMPSFSQFGEQPSGPSGAFAPVRIPILSGPWHPTKQSLLMATNNIDCSGHDLFLLDTYAGVAYLSAKTTAHVAWSLLALGGLPAWCYRPEMSAEEGSRDFPRVFSVWLLWPLPVVNIFIAASPRVLPIRRMPGAEILLDRDQSLACNEPRQPPMSRCNPRGLGVPLNYALRSVWCAPHARDQPSGSRTWPRGWLQRYGATCCSGQQLGPGDKYQGKAAELPQGISDRRSNPVHNTCDVSRSVDTAAYGLSR
ncbi:hypothetical protein V8F06_000972 [Rhypophila decipiens]